MFSCITTILLVKLRKLTVLWKYLLISRPYPYFPSGAQRVIYSHSPLKSHTTIFDCLSSVSVCSRLPAPPHTPHYSNFSKRMFYILELLAVILMCFLKILLNFCKLGDSSESLIRLRLQVTGRDIPKVITACSSVSVIPWSRGALLNSPL